ncbi:choice-of-anchor W domain-containing protein [Nostoc sp. PCC 7107]|uniref:choice-of-anchor W domain-containing protein n=1 Tax=Nostoc sp. PCC 7107 TaxID=317936 RepID=UPI00029F14F1|nr:choice-of-anchor W domain-containing protein [Nostoc sp. PCC 7107]AFY44451.1 PEP motif putative anchor domain protein [Nostoc sp. PCC 7107]
MPLLSKSKDNGQLLLTLGLVALGLFILPNSAKAVTLVPLTSQDADADFDDTDFNLLLDKGDFQELFVAEGRIGNNGFGGNNERELGINRDVRAIVNAGQPVAKSDLVWGNGKIWDFSLEYTGSKVTYKVFDANQTYQLMTQEFNGAVTDIFFRTFANKGSGNNLQNAVSLTNLTFNNTALGSLGSASTNTTADLDYLHLAGISTPFTLTGKTAFSWVGTAPSRSNLAFQIKVGTSQSVPEPSTLGAIFLATITGAAVFKRQKIAAEKS